jgi:hypothetical protein
MAQYPLNSLIPNVCMRTYWIIEDLLACRFAYAYKIMDRHSQLDGNTIDEILGSVELSSFQFLYLILWERDTKNVCERSKKTYVDDVYKGLVQEDNRPGRAIRFKVEKNSQKNIRNNADIVIDEIAYDSR